MKLLDDIKTMLCLKECGAANYYGKSVREDWAIIDDCDNMTEMEKILRRDISMHKRMVESQKIINDWSDDIMAASNRMSVRLICLCLTGIVTVLVCSLYVDWIMI